MANIYLSSVDGSDSDNGTTWALAKATLAAALTAAGSGGTVWVDNAHAETQATSMTLTSPGTVAAPVNIVCVSRAGNPQPPTTRATTATVACTNSNASITFAGVAVSYGVNYLCGFHALFTGATVNWDVTAPLLSIGTGGNGGARLTVGSNGTEQRTVMRFTLDELRFNTTAQGVFSQGGNTTYRIGAIGGSAPTTLIRETAATLHVSSLWIGCDLSAITGTLMVAPVAGLTTFMNCKLGAGVALTSGSFGGYGSLVRIINADSADTNYRYARQDVAGLETQETSIVRSGGASDGTTPVSRKIATSAPTIYEQYESAWMTFWNEVIGSAVVVTVPVLTDNVTLTDAEAWVEVEYLGTSGFPVGARITDRVTDPTFGTPANQATDSVSTWNGTGGFTSPVKQSLSVSFTPQEIGLIRARVVIAKASTTVYYDPLILSGSGRQYQELETYANEGVRSGAASMIAGAGVRRSSLY